MPRSAPAVFSLRARFNWVLVALAARLLALSWAGSRLRCAFDECSYLRLAAALASGQGWLSEKGFLWPPGYTAFLAPLVGADGRGLFHARLVQSCLGALLVWPVAEFAIQASLSFSRRRSLAIHLACGFVALDPTLIAYAHLLWPETVFLLVLVPAINKILAAFRTGRISRALLAGVLVGLAGLVRALGFWLGLPLALVTALFSQSRQRFRVLGWVVLGVLLTISPWTVRNALAYGRFLLIDATAGTNLFLGNTDAPPVTWDWGSPARSRVHGARQRCAEGDFILTDRCEQRRAVIWMARHPGHFLRRCLTKWADLVNPTSFLVRHVRAGRYGNRPMGEIPPGQAALVTLTAGLPWMIMAVLACFGLAAAPPSPERRLVVVLILGLLMVHSLTFGMSRFRLPAVPFLAVYAGMAAANMAGGHVWPQPIMARLKVVLILIFLLWLWSLRLGPLLDFAPLRLAT